MSQNRYITAEELDLLSFFEVEPKIVDEDIAWPYNDFCYEVVRNEISISFSIAPADKDVRIIVRRNGQLFYELNARGVDDVKYHNDDGRELLEVVLNARENLLIQMKPAINLKQNFERNI